MRVALEEETRAFLRTRSFDELVEHCLESSRLNRQLQVVLSSYTDQVERLGHEVLDLQGDAYDVEEEATRCARMLTLATAHLQMIADGNYHDSFGPENIAEEALLAVQKIAAE